MADREFSSDDFDLEEILSEIRAEAAEERDSAVRREPEAEVEAETDAAAEVKGPGAFAEELYDWIQALVTALLCSIIVFIFVGRLIGVQGFSMEHTLENKDRIIMSNLFYEPKQGDIVVVTVKSFSNEPIVKRIIATEGQTVDINFETGDVTVDGIVLREPYIAETTRRKIDMIFPATVPEGCIFVMGDNRNASTDSRDSRIGMVDKRCILGRVYAVLLPFSHFKKIT